MEELHLTCINCPIGCDLTVKLENGEVKEVTGNQCNRGVAYARMESTNPTRMFTSTVPLRGGALSTLPVKTASPVPKGKVLELATALKDVDVKAPVALGQVILPNIADTGVDIIATRSAAAQMN